MSEGIEGVALPSVPKGTVRRKTPTPFARPAISIGTPTAAKRVWRWIAVQDLAPGDVIPGVGLVREVDTSDFYVPPAGSGLEPDQIVEAVRWNVTVHGGEDNRRTWPYGEQVWAYSLPGDPG